VIIVLAVLSRGDTLALAMRADRLTAPPDFFQMCNALLFGVIIFGECG